MKYMSGMGLLVAVLVVITGGCGDMSSYMNAGPGGGDFGATQGGVQDMGLARELIENGRVPPAEAFTVEGMFSEHDLPVQGAACSRLLCLRGALGVAPTLEGESSGWVQVGLSSTIDLETFHRPSLTLIATVDVSGSMGWDYSSEELEYPTPGCIARKLLEEIASRLGPDDHIAIVTYGSDVSTLLDLTSGDDQEEIGRAIESLSARGSTNMEAGLQRAYQIAREADTATDQTRIMLFTDVQPNVGATSATEFESMAQAGADEGIGLTVMGVGLGLGQEVLNAMVHLKGGNAFSLFDYDDVGELLQDDWPWLVSPIAYNLSVELTPSDGFHTAEAYGFPGDQEEPEARLQVATVFLSKRKGALLVRIAPDQDVSLAGLSTRGYLSYQTPQGQEVSETFQVAYANQELDGRNQYYEQPGVAKTVALAVLVSNMKRAAELYGQKPEEAVALMQAAAERIEADALALSDPALQLEVTLAKDLLALMQQGAEQGDLYDEHY